MWWDEHHAHHLHHPQPRCCHYHIMRVFNVLSFFGSFVNDFCSCFMWSVGKCITGVSDIIIFTNEFTFAKIHGSLNVLEGFGIAEKIPRHEYFLLKYLVDKYFLHFLFVGGDSGGRQGPRLSEPAVDRNRICLFAGKPPRVTVKSSLPPFVLLTAVVKCSNYADLQYDADFELLNAFLLFAAFRFIILVFILVSFLENYFKFFFVEIQFYLSYLFKTIIYLTILQSKN